MNAIMKISGIKIEKVKLELYKPFKIALGVIEHFDTIIIKVETDEGLSGVGECSPIEFVTGESIDTVISVIRGIEKQIVGLDPLDIELIHNIMDRYITNNTSAKAGIDIALHDIKGKQMNVPLYKVLGGYSDHIETDITIPILEPEEMVEEARRNIANGFKILKLKAGIDPRKDIQSVRLIREAVGNDKKLRIDANQGWTVSEAVMVIKAIEQYNVEEIEQPRPYWDLEGMAFIRSKVDAKVMLDESVFSPVDALKAISMKSADAINIKLMKSCGLYKAEQINLFFIT
jgi:L-alanine-DL-glutamate epimerase-like enolase superfamily enzyme